MDAFSENHSWVSQEGWLDSPDDERALDYPILASLHMRTAGDLFGGPEGSTLTDKLMGTRTMSS